MPTFHALPHLSDTAVADVLQISRTRILKFLSRRGVVDIDDNVVTVTDDLADRDPVLAALASASVLGLPPAGPARRKPMLVALRGHGGHAEPKIKSPLCIDHAGFGLHAASTARADDARGRLALVKYVLRPPVANERLQITADGNVRLLLKKAFRDGATAIEMRPLALLTRLATAVHPPRHHVVGYFGVLSSASRLRPLVVPPLPTPEPTAAPSPHAPPPPAEPDGRKPLVLWSEPARAAPAWWLEALQPGLPVPVGEGTPRALSPPPVAPAGRPRLAWATSRRPPSPGSASSSARASTSDLRVDPDENARSRVAHVVRCGQDEDDTGNNSGSNQADHGPGTEVHAG